MAIDAGRATLITAYILTAVAFLIISSRIFLRKLKNEPFKLDDWIMLASIPFYFMDTACYQVILLNGSNLVPLPKTFTQDDINARVLGSKFALLDRLLYLTYIWMLKACILIYFTRLTSRVSELKLIKVAGLVLALTWIGCMLSSFLPCRPFNKYFQVYPNPGPDCTIATDALITTGSTDIATVVLLMFIPLLMILRAHLLTRTKIQLCAIYFVGFFIIAISITRMIVVLQNLTQFMGQIEFFVVTIAANAPVIHDLCRDIEYRKQSQYGRSSVKISANGRPGPKFEEPGSSAIKLNPVGITDSPSDSQWQVPDDEDGASNRNSSESPRRNVFAISRTIEVRQDTRQVDFDSDSARKVEVKTAIYGKRREEK